MKNIELILVNDGSNDRSGEICEMYKRKDDRVIVIHKTNGGLSSARNAGLEVVTGNFIGFVDSDDWIEPDFYQLLYQGLVTYGADIAVLHFKKVSDFDKIAFQTDEIKIWRCFNKNEAMELLFANNYIGYSAVNKLYRSELFFGVRYPEGMLMEDKATTYKLIHNCESIVVNESTKYHYFLRENSIIQSTFNNKKFDSFTIHEELIKFIDNYYPKLAGVVRGRYVYASIRMLFMMIKSNYYEDNAAFERCTNVIKLYYKETIVEKRMKVLIKVLTIAFLMFPGLPKHMARCRIFSMLFKKVRIS